MFASFLSWMTREQIHGKVCLKHVLKVCLSVRNNIPSIDLDTTSKESHIQLYTNLWH